MEDYKNLFETLKAVDRYYGISYFLTQPSILILIIASLALLILLNSMGKPKSERTNAVLADKMVKFNLCRKAVKQIEQNKIDPVCLYAGSFKTWQINPLILWFSIYVLNRPPTIFVPSANPGVEILGAPRIGKTFSAIDPLLYSAIDRSLPILCYDYKGGEYGGKGGQIPVVGGYAARHNYKIRIFAPGQDYTCTINPLDFLKDGNDRTMAEVLAVTLYENLRDNTSKEDNFFGPASKRLLYASFMLAKNTQYPDLAMAYALLKLPKLGERLRYIEKKGSTAYTVWNEIVFAQFVAFAEGGKTSDSILAGALDVASVFMQPDLLPCILGKTNVPLKLDGKNIVFFQSNESYKEVYNPLIAAIIQLTIRRNFSYQRKIPLVLSLDEYPSIKIQKSTEWPNLLGSKGLIMLIGYQTESQVVKKYGKDDLSELRTGLLSKFLFNPRNEENEAKISKALGEKEIIVKNKSRSLGSSKGTTISEQKLMTPHFRPDDIGGMPKGMAIYRSPYLKKGSRANIPWVMNRMRVSRRDKRQKKKSEQIWFDSSLQKLHVREQQRRPDLDLELEMKKRFKEADKIFPLPKDKSSDFDTSDPLNFL